MRLHHYRLNIAAVAAVVLLGIDSDVLRAQSESYRYASPGSGMRPIPVFTESMIPGPPAALPIIENGGQLPESTQFHVRGYDYDLLFGATGLSVVRRYGGDTPRVDRTELEFIGASSTAVVHGENPFPGVLNYIKGSDESRWAYGLKVYRRIRYEDLYPGVSLTVEGRHGRLIQTFEVAAGVDPGSIRMSYEDSAFEIAMDGSANVVSKAATKRLNQPQIREIGEGTSVPVQGGFQVSSSGALTFDVPNRREDHALVIEAEVSVELYDELPPLAAANSAVISTPEESFFTYIGGTGSDFGRGGHNLPDGDIVAALQVVSENLPTHDGAFQSERADPTGDAYVIRFRPFNGDILWATYYGSDALDFVFGFACLDDAESCAVAGSTFGAMPGGPTANENTMDTDPWVTMLDFNTGIPQQVFQNTDPLDGGCNSVTEYPGGFLMAGFESDGTSINGTVTTYSQDDGPWDSATRSSPDPNADFTFFDAVKSGNTIVAGGAGDRNVNQAVFDTQGMNRVVGIVVGEEFTLHHEVQDERAWHEDVTIAGAYVCLSTYVELDAQNQFADAFDVDCASIDGLPTSYLGRTTVFTGDGIPQDISGNTAGDLWVVHPSHDAEAAPRIANTIVDLPPTADVWTTMPPSLDMAFLPHRFVQVLSFDGGYPAINNFGTAFLGGEVSPNAPEAFQNLPMTGIAGAVYFSDVLGYGATINLESSTHFLDAGIPNVSDSPASDVHQSYALEPDGFSGFPFPLGQEATITPSGGDPITIGGLNVLNYHVFDGSDSFTASVERIPNRGDGFAFINATGEDVNVKSGLQIEFDNWDNDENIEDKGVVVVAQSAHEGETGILIRVTDTGTNAFEDFIIPKEFASQAIKDEANVMTLVIDDPATGGKSGVQIFRLLAFDLSGQPIEARVTTDIEDRPSVPTSFQLHQNYPNPFNPSTTIVFDLPIVSTVRLTVVNTLGQQVWEWSNDVMDAGRHEVKWNASDLTGKTLPSGLYLYRLEAGEYVESRTLTLVR